MSTASAELLSVTHQILSNMGLIAQSVRAVLMSDTYGWGSGLLGICVCSISIYYKDLMSEAKNWIEISQIVFLFSTIAYLFISFDTFFGIPLQSVELAVSHWQGISDDRKNVWTMATSLYSLLVIFFTIVKITRIKTSYLVSLSGLFIAVSSLYYQELFDASKHVRNGALVVACLVFIFVSGLYISEQRKHKKELARRHRMMGKFRSQTSSSKNPSI